MVVFIPMMSKGLDRDVKTFASTDTTIEFI